MHSKKIHLIFTADCGRPDDIPRATYKKGPTLEGSSIMYNCDVNTVTEGMPVITCGSDGRWSETDLYCRRRYSFLFSGDGGNACNNMWQ